MKKLFSIVVSIFKAFGTDNIIVLIFCTAIICTILIENLRKEPTIETQIAINSFIKLLPNECYTQYGTNICNYELSNGKTIYLNYNYVKFNSIMYYNKITMEINKNNLSIYGYYTSKDILVPYVKVKLLSVDNNYAVYKLYKSYRGSSK